MSAKDRKPIKFIAAGDSHGDMIDWEAADALREFLADYRPEVRVCLGDAFDFRALRRGVDGKERQESIMEDIDAGLHFLTKILRPTVYLYGNHEDRLDAIISSELDATRREAVQSIKDRINREVRKAGCKTILPYHAEQGVWKLGPVTYIHGYAHGVNATTVQGQHYCSPGGALIHGHTHNLASISLTQHGSGNAFSAGCLCRKADMTYSKNRLATSRWGSGWVAGWVDGDNYKAFLVHKVGKRWIWSSDLRVYTPKQHKWG